MIEEKAHAEYSASGSERWLNCPGSIKLSKKAPPQEESKYATEGTEAHKVLEEILLSSDVKRKSRELLKKYPLEMVEHALFALDEIEKLTPHGAERIAETKVDASSFTKPDQFGTVDVSIIEHFGWLRVIDYKYGAGVAVTPKENSQLIYYALGLAHKYDYNFSHVEIIIIQPRAQHKDGPVRKWAISIKELMSYIPKFKEGVKNCENPNPTFKVGTWCRWCPASTICPEFADKAFKSAQLAFSPIDPKPSVRDLPNPESLSIKNLSQILEAIDLIENWIGKVRAHAFFVMKRGEKIKGWKLVQKRSTRKWLKPELVAQEAEKLWGEAGFTKPELLSPAQFEKALKDDDTVFKWVARRVSDISSGVTLVKADDSRPEIGNVEMVFTKLDDDGKELEDSKKEPVRRKKISKSKLTAKKG